MNMNLIVFMQDQESCVNICSNDQSFNPGLSSDKSLTLHSFLIGFVYLLGRKNQQGEPSCLVFFLIG